MALDQLLEAVTGHGAAEAQGILHAARDDAAAIRAAADARAEQRCADACASREAELRTEFDAKRERELRKSRVEILFKRGRCLDAIFAAAEARLPGALDCPASEPLLTRLAVEGLEYFPSGAARIRCRRGLAARLSTSLPSVPVVADDAVPEGVIVESSDGLSWIDNTLLARLKRQRRTLSITLLAALEKGA